MPMILWLEWGIDWFVEPWSNAPMQRGHVGALRFQGSWKLARKVVRKQLWKKSQTGLHFVASFEAFGYLCNPGGYQVSFWKESTLLERLVGYLAEKSEKNLKTSIFTKFPPPCNTPPNFKIQTRNDVGFSPFTFGCFRFRVFGAISSEWLRLRILKFRPGMVGGFPPPNTPWEP